MIVVGGRGGVHRALVIVVGGGRGGHGALVIAVGGRTWCLGDSGGGT